MLPVLFFEVLPLVISFVFSSFLIACLPDGSQDKDYMDLFKS
jgi:hypothetical protein